MRRLLDIQGQLYSMRALAKEAAAAQQQLLAGSSKAEGEATQAEQQRQLSHTLSRMARSSVDGGPACPADTKQE